MRTLRHLVAAFYLLLPFVTQDARNTLILATTTSTQDSGLLDTLVPVFEKQNRANVKVIAVGSGQAIAMGKSGEADVLLVHSPDAEVLFMEGGFGSSRKRVMHNDFVVVGPDTDPAKTRTAQSAAAAFAVIDKNKSLFISRADNSGTHAKELKIWKEASIKPQGKTWYQESGSSMGQTLNIASEKKAYTLADRGTFLALKKNLALSILSQKHDDLLNVYHVIVVNAQKFPKVNSALANRFSDFLLSKDIQSRIGEFGIKTYGEPLFTADSASSKNASKP